MPPTPIAMLSSYEGLTQADWLWNQTPYPFGLWGNIQMQATQPCPNWLLLYQFNFHKWLVPPAGSPLRRFLKGLKAGKIEPFEAGDPLRRLPPQLQTVPKERILFLLREPPLPEVHVSHLRNYALAQQYCGYVSGPDDDAPIPNYMPAIWYVERSFQELDQAPSPEKLRPCSWITSGISRTQNHRQRLAFLRQVQESDLSVDIYGRGLPAGTRSPGWLQNKWSGMAPYRYNLAIENYADNDWYVSEKLWDALLAWCLPIYYGGSAADKLLPPGSFLRLPSLGDAGIAYIREITASPDAWHQAKDAIAEARQVILHKLNLLNWLSETVAGKLRE